MQYYTDVLGLTARALAPRSGLQNLPRRERERLMRRQEIIDAGRHLFARRGYHQTTLDDVAEAVELGKATLYGYFDSKELLFESVLEDSFSTMKAIADAAMLGRGTLEERIRMFVAAEMDFFFRNPSSLRLMMSEAHQLRGRNPMFRLMPQLIGLLSDAFAGAQQEGEIIAKAVPGDLAGTLIHMMYGQFMARIYRKIKEEIRQGEVELNDEKLAETLQVMDAGKIEEAVIATTELIVTILFSGIRRGEG